MATKKYNLWQHYATCKITHITEGNQIITDVARLMLGGGTFLFGLSGALFGNKILILPLSLKILLIVSWVLIFKSFYFGIKQLIIDSSFLGTWGKNYSKAMETISNDEKDDNNIIKEAEEVLKSENVVSDMRYFWLQIYFMGIAFIIQIAVVSISLFLKMS